MVEDDGHEDRLYPYRLCRVGTGRDVKPGSGKHPVKLFPFCLGKGAPERLPFCLFVHLCKPECGHGASHFLYSTLTSLRAFSGRMISLDLYEFEATSLMSLSASS